MASPLARGIGAATVLAAGAAAGVLAERFMSRKWLAESHGQPLPAIAHSAEVRTVISDDGAPLHVEIDTPVTWQSGDPTVVLIHGFGLGLETWAAQRRELLCVARVIAYDHRGHQRSHSAHALTDPNLTIERLGRDLVSILDQCSPEGPVVCVGHSMGGMTIMALAEMQPEWFGTRIRAVALLATTAGGISNVDLGLPRGLARFAHRLTPAVGRFSERGGPLVELVTRLSGSTSDVGLVLTRTFAFGDTVPAHGTTLVSRLLSTTPVDVVGDLLVDIEKHDRHEVLDVIARVPALIIVGERDLLTPVGHSHTLVERIPGAELEILPGVGHMLTLEQPERVSELLEDFVRQVCGVVETADEHGGAA
jgi:pimeloyl-ACP methyl ester carboxylesterase